MADDVLTIGALARLAGCRASAIRDYEQLGLLPEPMRSGGQRRYSRDSLRVLAVIGVANADFRSADSGQLPRSGGWPVIIVMSC
jgi:MerR family redox-sensitive transcriptional activator SoxR